MIGYILKRLGQGAITAFVLLVITFVFARISGDPLDLVVPENASLAERARAAERLGLNQPYIVQFLKYVGGVLRGDFGDSIAYRKPVTELFIEAFPNTLKLALVALIFAMCIGVPLGIAAAVRRGGFVDQISKGLAALAMSTPTFWVGIVLIIVLSVHLRWLPVAGLQGPKSYILPGFCLSLHALAGTARLVRSSLIEALGSDYIKLARIKGASEFVVVVKHGLRNALLPVVTFVGSWVAAILGGAVTIEAVFAWPGVGQLVYRAVSGQDYPLEQGLILIIGLIVILGNLVVDILYTVIDPRIRITAGAR